MSKWQTFTGSQEQLLELSEAGHEVLVRGMSWSVPADDLSELMACFSICDTKEFLICNPHPLADMICQQAHTGQEVWVLEPVVGTEEHPLWPRLLAEGISRENVGTVITENGIFCQYSTHTPYWHIPGTQYSFTRIGGYRANK